MAFELAVTSTPEAIRGIQVTLTSHAVTAEKPEHKDVAYIVEVVYNNDEIKIVAGDLAPHLTQAQIDGLTAFMDDMRIKAVNEILPG